MDLDGAQDPIVPMIQNQLNELKLKGNALFVSDDEEDEAEGQDEDAETESMPEKKSTKS